MQTRLDNFFSVGSSPNGKKCFIYDPDNYRAFFANSPDKEDKLLTIKTGVKLYYRTPKTPHIVDFPIIETGAGIPLLKSNLQKAVRRRQTQIALNSALAIIQKDPIEFLRRLPIIYIEDVCLFDSYPIPVWLMMAEKEHRLDAADINILLHIVKNLCECGHYYDDVPDYTKPFELTHRTLKDSDTLLSLLYRSEYGGMKGDMKMLRNSIYYYFDHFSEIHKTIYGTIDYANYDARLQIIEQAIDFHPFPQLITMIAKQTGLDNEVIKRTIWFAESAINVRKQFTMDNSAEYTGTEAWKIIRPKLTSARKFVLN